jgi:hypothetical protein
LVLVEHLEVLHLQIGETME